MQDSYESRLAIWQKEKFAPPPEKPLRPTEPTLIAMAPMRDGVKLYTEIFLPESSTEAPVIFIRSPYPYSRPSRNDKHPLSRYQKAGYAVVFQLTRGQGKSEGDFHFFKDDINDGYDAIAWITEQTWSNGKVGMMGSSYLGGTQLLAAKAKPPALKCIMPTAFLGNSTQCFPFSNGVPNKGPYMQWHQVLEAESWDDVDVAYCDMSALDHPVWGAAFRKRPLVNSANEVLSGDKLVSWKKTIANPLDNDFWKDIHFTDKELAALDLPMFLTDGWYDMTIGPIDYFSRLEKSNPERPDRYLLVGPWDHYQTASTSQPGDNNGDRILPDNAACDHGDLRLAFFDRYLKGDTTSRVQEDRVRVYITGATDSNANLWKNFSTFPVPNTEYKKLYLHSQGDARSFPGDGVLNWDLPSDEPSDHYIYDPALPTHSQVETSHDRREVEIRSDVLTYTSKPLTSPLTILGDIELTLHAASDAPDTDWFAIFTEVYPDGQSKSFHYAPPAFRARYREGFDREVLLTPKKSEEFRIPMGPAGHQIAAGHCLRLSIFSAAFPEYDPNSNTGKPAATDTDSRIAKQTIFHDANRLSHLVLPVIQLDE
jgi:putative CocE/NonD family hydrolase